MEIVGACLSQFHDDENNFELLLSYSDGREVGFAVSRSVAKQMAAELATGTGAMEHAGFVTPSNASALSRGLGGVMTVSAEGNAHYSTPIYAGQPTHHHHEEEMSHGKTL